MMPQSWSVRDHICQEINKFYQRARVVDLKKEPSTENGTRPQEELDSAR